MLAAMGMPASLPPGAEPISVGGFNKYIGPLYRLPDEDAGRVKRFAFLVADKHMNAVATVHGGMLMSFVDVSMSRTVRLITEAARCSTVSLNCDFVGPGKLGDLIESRVRLTRRTRSLVFLSAEIAAAHRLLVSAAGLWKIGGA